MLPRVALACRTTGARHRLCQHATLHRGYQSQRQRAVFMSGPGAVSWGSVPVPEAADGEVLVDVASVGICGSDLHYYRDGGIGSAVIDRPWVPGHEFAGWMVEDNDALGLRAGQLVAVDPARPCMACPQCDRGYTNLCPNVKFLGAPPVTDGGMTDRVAVPAECVWSVPRGTSPIEALMLEPLGVALHALAVAKPRPGDSVCVLGAGPIGLLVAQLLVRCPQLAPDLGPIYMYDPVPLRARLAVEIVEGGGGGGGGAGGSSSSSSGGGGAAAGSNAITYGSLEDGYPDGPAAVDAWTDGQGCDLVIEATNAPEGLYHAAGCAGLGGRVAVVGIPDGNGYVGDRTSDGWFSADVLRRKGLTIRWSRRMRGEEVYPAGIELLESGALDLEAVITHRYALEDAAEAFARQDDYESGVVKAAIEINSDPPTL